MSAFNLEDLHKTLYLNNIKIRNIEKENKSIIDTIKVVGTINKYDDDKLENLDSQLKEILKLQKKINNEITTEVCKSKKDKITDKYLNLPYDINEIIRKKIIDDSIVKKETDSLTYVFNGIEKHFLNILMHRVTDYVELVYNGGSTNEDNFITQLINYGRDRFDDCIINMLQFDNLYQLLDRTIMQTPHLTWNERKKYIRIIDLLCDNKYKNFAKSKLQQIKTKYANLVQTLKNLLRTYYMGLYNNIYRVDRIGDCLIRKTNGKKNGMGYRKLLKEICNIFVEKIPEYMNENTYKEWNMEDYNTFTYNSWFYEKFDSYPKQLKLTKSLSCFDKYSLQVGADGIMKALQNNEALYVEYNNN